MKTQGEIEAAICDGVRRFELEYMGRGPKDIHAYLIGDLLVVRLKGVLTAAEQQLVGTLAVEKGRDLLKQVRTQLVETAPPVLEAMVLEPTGVKALSRERGLVLAARQRHRDRLPRSPPAAGPLELVEERHAGRRGDAARLGPVDLDRLAVLPGVAVGDFQPGAAVDASRLRGAEPAEALGVEREAGLVVAADMTPITTAQTPWKTALGNNATAQAVAQAARQAKDTARSAVEAPLRAIVRRLQASPSVDNGERAAMGITVPDREGSPIGGAPTSRPVVNVDTSQRLQHTIHFADESSPTSKGKPAGVMGAEVWVKVAAVGQPPPADPSELTFLAVDTRTPYTTDFDGADAGKTAHYMLRWVSTTGEKGPWSETASATIGA